MFKRSKAAGTAIGAVARVVCVNGAFAILIPCLGDIGRVQPVLLTRGYDPRRPTLYPCWLMASGFLLLISLVSPPIYTIPYSLFALDEASAKSVIVDGDMKGS